MKISNKKLLFFVITVGLFLPISKVFTAEFNPNHIISDQDMQDWKSMGRGEIQAFLKNRGPFLAKFITKNLEGKKRRAADIIYEVAKEYKISPKYILVKLQKEQSLITAKNPTNYQLNYATGYGVCDDCDTDDPNVSKHSGFAKQVDSAAGIIRWYYENFEKENWIKRDNTEYQIDDQLVTPANLATAFLYTYTPHLHGNKNFWKLWQQWFDQVYPDGSILKGENESNIYVIKDGKKSAIKSMSVLISRYDPKSIITVPVSELARYENGPEIKFANFSLLKISNKYYLINFDELRPFKDYDVIRKLGYHPDEIIEATGEDKENFKIGATIEESEQYPFGRIIKTDSGQIYYINQGQYHVIADKLIAQKKYPQLMIEKGSAKLLKGLTRGNSVLFPDGVLIGNDLTKMIYVIENGSKRHITSEKVFNGLGYKWSNVIWASDFVLNLHKFAEPVYLKESASPAVKDDFVLTSAKYQPVDYDAPKQTVPIEINSRGKVLATSKEDTKYIGEKTFNTGIYTYIAADFETGEILAGKNIDVIRPMASFTKAMTAQVLFDAGIDIEASSTYDAYTQKSGHHRYRIAHGESVKNDDLLKVFLAISHNTPGNILASNVGGAENCVKKMNAKLKEWGLVNTYFEDTHGLGLKNQTTARDYLYIFKNVLQDQRILDYMGEKRFSYVETVDKDWQPNHSGAHSNTLILQNHANFEILSSKTGYLYESGFNLANLIERKSDGKKFIVITMGEPDYNNRLYNAKRFANWVVKNF